VPAHDVAASTNPLGQPQGVAPTDANPTGRIQPLYGHAPVPAHDVAM